MATTFINDTSQNFATLQAIAWAVQPSKVQVHLALGYSKGPADALAFDMGPPTGMFVEMASPDTGRFPAYVSNGLKPSQGTGSPSHLCACGPDASTAAPAPADSQPMSLWTLAMPFFLNGGANSSLGACWQVHWINGHSDWSHGQPNGLKPAHSFNTGASRGPNTGPWLATAFSQNLKRTKEFFNDSLALADRSYLRIIARAHSSLASPM